MTDHSAPPELEFELADEAATRLLGARLAPALSPGLKLYLHGDLGAGKTTLVRALLEALGHTGRVKSPTYTLVELYTVSRLHLSHFDFYRFRDSHEWREAGFSDYFGGDGICLVEWPEKAGSDLPQPDLDIIIDSVGDAAEPSCDTHHDSERTAPGESRHVRLVAHTLAGKQCVASLTASNSPAKPS